MATTINIANSTRKFVGLSNNWTATNTFIDGNTSVKTVASDDFSNSAASTEWVNRYMSSQIDVKPTINVPMLTPMWFDHEVVSPAWVKSDFANNKWISASSYPYLFNHIQKDYEAVKNNAMQTEFIGDLIISYYLAQDGHRIICASSDADDLPHNKVFEKTGISWYYIYDSNNRRIKLPRSRFSFQGQKRGGYVGKYDAPGIPDVSYSVNYTKQTATYGVSQQPVFHYSYTAPSLTLNKKEQELNFTGVTNEDNHKHVIFFSQSATGKGYPHHGGTSHCAHEGETESYTHHHTLTASVKFTPDVTHTWNPGSFSGYNDNVSIYMNLTDGGVSLNSSKDSNIYGKSTTVQCPAVEMYLYFSTGEESVNSNIAFPSSVADSAFTIASASPASTITGSVSKTADRNGWYQVNSEFTASPSENESAYITIQNDSNFLTSKYSARSGNETMYLNMPVQKGQSVTISYFGKFQTNIVGKFVYCEGDKNG